MKITHAKFIKGVVEEEAIMYDGTPHIAFIGRSNVGKSSTLNVLLERKNLVKVGRTPGKTKEINFFDVKTDEEHYAYFVDLPGYGYAKISKTDRKKLENMINWYVSHPMSDNKLIVLIIDSKAGLTDFDKEMINLVNESNKELLLAVNKIDKLNQKGLNQLKKDIKEIIPNAETGKNIFYYSAMKNKNTHLLREAVFNVLK